MSELRLEVLGFKGPTEWRWRLTEIETGAFIADHEVRLRRKDWQFEAFTSLSSYLDWHAVPSRRAESETEIVDAVGTWVGDQVLGPIATAVVERAPATVRVEIPEHAQLVSYLPLELGYVNGRPLALHGASLVLIARTARKVPKAPVGDRLRMLGVFSLPTDASALNLRRERFGLGQLVRDIVTTNGKRRSSCG